MRVLDGAVTIMDASAGIRISLHLQALYFLADITCDICIISGVEAQTLTVWRQANRYAIPRIVYLNKMDKKGADFGMSVESLKNKLHAKPLVLHLPLGREKDFQGVVDIVSMQKHCWDDEGSEGTKFETSTVTEEDGQMWQKAVELREDLVGQLSDVDERIAEKILTESDMLEIPTELLYSAIRKATVRNIFCPVLCGSSFKKKGVQLLLDAIALYLPNPAEIHHSFIEYYKNDLCALAFKIIHDKQRGALTFLRIYTGSLTNNSSIYNVNRECSEKITRLLQVNADEMRDLSSSGAGNIVAVSGMKQVFPVLHVMSYKMYFISNIIFIMLSKQQIFLSTTCSFLDDNRRHNHQ